MHGLVSHGDHIVRMTDFRGADFACSCNEWFELSLIAEKDEPRLQSLAHCIGDAVDNSFWSRIAAHSVDRKHKLVAA